MNEHPKKIQITNAKLVLPSQVITGNLEIENGCITKVGGHSPSQNADIRIDAEGKYVLPGFIDIHTNGIAGFDLTNGVYDLQSEQFLSDKESYFSGLDQACLQYVKTGSTRVILTSLAAPIDQLLKVFEYVHQYRTNGPQNDWKDVLGGLFIEGTFMKDVAFRGAHNPEYFHKPSVDLFNRLQQASGNRIKIVNIVPEWEHDALQLISYLSSQNIICAAGHTGATGRQYQKAIDSGLRLAIHFLNGPTGSSSKPFDGGGAVETILRSDDISVELIVDGYHVDKAYVLDTIKRKDFDRVIAITDSMFTVELAGLKEFQVFNIKGKVSDNGDYLHIADRSNALFGSNLVMSEAFSNLLTWLTEPVQGIWNAVHQPFDFNDALIKTSAMCSGNPAKVLGIYQSDQSTGSIQVGKSADIIIGDIHPENDRYRFNIENVFLKGKMIV